MDNIFAARVRALQEKMELKGIDAYIIPTDDYHCSEYVGDFFKERAFMSGFTGSAGTLVVCKESAHLWTDGRYFIQAAKQLEHTGICLMKMGEKGVPTIERYLVDNLKENAVIGFDAGTVSAKFVQSLQRGFGVKAIQFYGKEDLVGELWTDRPALSANPVWELAVEYAGCTREEKMANLRKKMEDANIDQVLITALDEIAWLTNLRGDDVKCTPVFLAYMIVTLEKAFLFANESIFSEEVKGLLKSANITLCPYENVDAELAKIESGQRILIDSSMTNYRLLKSIAEDAVVVDQASFIEKMKAVKTEKEMEHTRLAHVKDGVAVTRFMYWLKTRVATEKITEISAAEYLERLREQGEGYIGPSFDPIIAYGEHGAIVHYSATEETDALMQPRGLCLADTGGQYLDGTTDITRTFAMGDLTEEEKRCFTLVLKGNLNLGAACFKYGTCGQNLDILARTPLWEQGLDYNHGTGHGVGYLLNVHEGPQNIRYRLAGGSEPAVFEEGMITSNEPGMYVEGKFGIRHENLVLCKAKEETEYGKFLEFETLTLVPFDLDAILPELLTEREKVLLNQYHATVRQKLSPFMQGEELDFLIKATAAI